MYVNELLTKVTVIETSAPKKQAAIIATVSNMDGTMESLAVKQVDGRLEDVIKAAIAEAQAALVGTDEADEVETASTELDGNEEIVSDAVDVTPAEEMSDAVTEYTNEAEEAIQTGNTENIGEKKETSEIGEEVPLDFSADDASEEMAIPDSEASMYDELLSDIEKTVFAPEKIKEEVDRFAAELEERISKTETVENKVATAEPDAVTTEGITEEATTKTEEVSEDPAEEVPSEAKEDGVTEDVTAPVTEDVSETTDDLQDFMVTIGVHASSPMMVSECAELLAKSTPQECKMLRQAVTTVAYAKSRGGNPDVIKQASDYLAYMEAKGLYEKEV